MKKLISLLLALALILSLSACSLDETPDSSQLQENNSSNNNSSNSNSSNKSPELTFTETIVVDNDDCSIKLTKIENDSIWGFTIKAQLENKTSDKSFMFSVENAAINGVQTDPFFAATVAAGKKANESISFSDDTLEENGIDCYTDIELTFRVYDSENWLADDVVNTTIHIYPYGEDKVEQYTRAAQPSDNILVDNEYVTAIVTGYEEDSIWGYTINLFLVNKTDSEVMFTTENESVNGYMIDPLYADSVSAGKCAFSSISFSNSSLEENEITEIEDFEFVFRAYNSDHWLADDFVNKSITLNP